MRHRNLLIVGALAVLGLVAACGADTPGQSNPTPGGPTGTLTGAVTIGPLCPIEPCDQPIGDVYSSRVLLLTPDNASTTRVPLNAGGAFEALVPADTYQVELSDCEFLGCASTFPLSVAIVAGETTTLTIDIDTGIRGVQQGDLADLIDRLEAAGASVELGDIVTQPFFSVPGRSVTVDGNGILVYEYPSAADAAAAAANISPDGSSITHNSSVTHVDWIAPPHFYLAGTLIVQYVGRDTALTGLLDDVLGSQFAGAGTPTVTPEPDVPAVVDEAARQALASRLGVQPGTLILVNAAHVTFSNGALGCPQPGFFYTEALVDGYRLVYEHQGLRYQYHVSALGGQLTDCIGAEVTALPWRDGGDVVTVNNAFGLTDRSDSLAAQVVLRSADEARAYVDQHGGAIAIDTGAIDWSSQLLAGAVVTGTGCGLDVWVAGVRSDGTDDSVTIEVVRIVPGGPQCEMFGAAPLWLILDDVPANDEVSFTLDVIRQ